MTITPPNRDQILQIAERYGFSLTTDDAIEYEGYLRDLSAAFDRLDEYPEPKLPVKYPRTPGYRPGPAEDPYNAWHCKTEIRGAASGPLAGKKIAIKDTVCVAGVPMMNGTRVLEGFVPDIDATVVTRILDAGGTIMGKAATTDLSFDGNGHGNAPRELRNPWKPTHGAGGSSGGSAILVSTGEVDIALGGDQAGSIRLPASWTGVYGLKPTFGVVPYTGIMGSDMTLDTVGPMAARVADLPLLLQVMAGSDGLDPRQGTPVPVQDYAAGLGQGVKGLRLGVVREGFGQDQMGLLGPSEPEVDRKVRAAVKLFERLGAEAEEISIPEHADGPCFWFGIGIEGSTAQMINGHGVGSNWQGYHNTTLRDMYARGWKTQPNDLPDTVKLTIFMGQYLYDQYNGRYYSKAQNLRRTLRAAYDAQLESYDILVMPTTPMRAQEIPPRDCSRELFLRRAWEMMRNTAPISVSGHPAMSVPCGLADGLPVGMMLVGRHFDEVTLIRAAHALEQAEDWKTL